MFESTTSVKNDVILGGVLSASKIELFKINFFSGNKLISFLHKTIIISQDIKRNLRMKLLEMKLS